MKMSSEYFDALQKVIGATDTAETRAQYIAGDFPRSDRVKDLDKRYRWDQFWHAQRELAAAGIRIPADLADAHIETALKRIVSPLNA